MRIDGQNMLGSTTTPVGTGCSNVARPRMPICLMASLLSLKHSFNLSDEDVRERWSESPLRQFVSGLRWLLRAIATLGIVPALLCLLQKALRPVLVLRWAQVSGIRARLAK